VSLIAGLLAVLGTAAPVHAQDARWGAAVNVSPVWVQSPLTLFSPDITYRGIEFRAGIIHGADRGGNWGVSVVRARGTNRRFVGAVDISQDEVPVVRKVSLTRAVTLTGLEVHRFTSFRKISHRGEIGLDYGGGIARVHETIDDNDFASPLFRRSLIGLVRVEVTGGILVAPGAALILKGGLTLPQGLSASVGFNYFFGR
jgi:hypothetical protein